jgi:asparagine synthase (glutamine-hydrolysing)
LTVGRDKSSVRCYWNLDPRRELRLGSDAEYVEAFREVFSEAVRCRTRSAFPIGSSLSGGLDSSSVACLARDTKPAGAGPVHTFSLIFPELPAEDRRSIDERPHMHQVLETGGFVPHFIQADRLSPMWQVDRIHYHLDHANCAPNLYLHWAMYDAAKAQGVRVFLDGFDGDSAVSHGFERLTELAQTLRWRTLWRETTMLSQQHLRGIARRRILKEYCVKPLTPRWAFLAWQVLRGRKREAFSQNVLISQALKRRTDIERRAKKMLAAQSAWSLRSARELHEGYITQALYAYTLEIADKASAAFGLEARYPFFDRRVLEFCVSLPADQKLGQGWNRWILRRAMTGILPPDVQWRANKGNLSPNFHRRLLDFERQRLEEVSLGCSPDLARFFDESALESTYREYEKNHVRSQGESIQLFAAVNLALWLRATKFVPEPECVVGRPA